MDSSAFSGIGKMMTVMMIVLCLSVPLGLWKLAEIIIWLWRHVSVTIK